ncbi:MAG TPA: PEP-CTERM sorting domain-containing protein [Verrucomicrobiae bacterium]|nr:PEP-CTERM sorting domain-containing protein [Verrucomicrobiae bacterium]
MRLKHVELLRTAIPSLFLVAGVPCWGDALTNASALWKFDGASSGFVTNANQIVDSSGNGHGATAMTNPGNTNISWASVPLVGPGGAATVDPFVTEGRGLSLQPGLVSSGLTDTVAAVGFTVNNFSVKGSATIATRFLWDGYISDDSGAQMAWLYGNGFGASNGWLFGVQNTGTEARLKLFQLNFTTFDSGYVMQTGVWYDAVVVLTENIESGGAGDIASFYLYPAGGSLLTTNLNGTIWTNSAPTSLIGNETLSTGTGNQRKAFDGSIDYLAVWDRPLSQDEVLGLIIPEPTTIWLLAAGAGALLVMARRRRS